MPHALLIEPPKGTKKQGGGMIGLGAPFRKPQRLRKLRVISGRWRGLEGAEKTVPPGDERRKITIPPAAVNEVVSPVEGWGDPQPAQSPFKPRRKAEIGVVKLGRGTHQRLEEEPRHRGWAEHRQPKRFSKAGQQ